MTNMFVLKMYHACAEGRKTFHSFCRLALFHISPPKMEPNLSADLGEGGRTHTSLLLSPQDLFSKKQQLLDSTGDELRALGSSPPQWVGRQEKNLFRL